MRGELFSKYFLQDFINAVGNQLGEAINKLAITDAIDINQLIAHYIQEYRIEPLKLLEPVPSEPKEAYRTIPGDFGRDLKQKVFEMKVNLPFEGNGELFYCRPSTTVLIYPRYDSLDIQHKRFTLNLVFTELDAHQYQKEIGNFQSDLMRNIPTINQEIEPWNDSLKGTIERMLDQRKGTVTKKHSFMEQIGLKRNPASDTFMVPPPIARKAIPKPVTETSGSHKKEAIPVLQDAVYFDIKEVLYNVGRAMERKPSLYFGKHEEDLRDIFLLFLETRYESTTGVGEAFNKKGKTDILLKYAKDGTNIFVAECKFWKGAKKYHETIDQLFSYLTTRDSKAAVMMFVDQKDFQNVINTVEEETPNHPQFRLEYCLTLQCFYLISLSTATSQ